MRPGDPGTVCVRIGSWRARQRVKALLGSLPDEYVEIRDRFPWPCFYVVSADRLDELLAIPSVRRLRKVSTVFMQTLKGW